MFLSCSIWQALGCLAVYKVYFYFLSLIEVNFAILCPEKVRKSVCLLACPCNSVSVRLFSSTYIRSFLIQWCRLKTWLRYEESCFLHNDLNPRNICEFWQQNSLAKNGFLKEKLCAGFKVSLSLRIVALFALRSLGLPGRACVLRTVCEIGRRPVDDLGLLGDILNLIFSLVAMALFLSFCMTSSLF